MEDFDCDKCREREDEVQVQLAHLVDCENKARQKMYLTCKHLRSVKDEVKVTSSLYRLDHSERMKRQMEKMERVDLYCTKLFHTRVKEWSELVFLIEWTKSQSGCVCYLRETA